MNFSEENRRALVAEYLASSEARLRAARILLDAQQWADAVSRAYYAVLDAATACLVQRDILPKSHEGTMTLFSQHYVKPGVVEARFADIFKRIRKARLEADYRHEQTLTREDAERACMQAAEFVAMAKTVAGSG